MESACRLNPELRSEHPEIDQKLKEEEARPAGASHPPQRPGQWVSSLPRDDEARLREALSTRIRSSDSPVEAKQTLLATLEIELAQAPEHERAALTRALELAREIPAEPWPVPERPIPFATLTLHARMLLGEKPNANERKIEAVLGPFELERLNTDPNMKVTAENYYKLARALREVDPQFQAEWRKSVLLQYPWLDRVLPREGR